MFDFCLFSLSLVSGRISLARLEMLYLYELSLGQCKDKANISNSLRLGVKAETGG